MGRFWLGIGLLLLFLVLGIWTAASMAHIHEPMGALLEEASRVTLDGDIGTGTALARQAKASWEKHRFRTASVADHTPMDEIDSLFAEMEVYAEARETVHFAACCAQLAKMVQSMSEAHKCSWGNFL